MVLDLPVRKIAGGLYSCAVIFSWLLLPKEFDYKTDNLCDKLVLFTLFLTAKTIKAFPVITIVLYCIKSIHEKAIIKTLGLGSCVCVMLVSLSCKKVVVFHPFTGRLSRAHVRSVLC